MVNHLTLAITITFLALSQVQAGKHDYEAEAALALAKATIKEPEPEPVVPKPEPTVVRSPLGHTHTCANGHTWDHATNPTHTCQVCGLSQYIQDSVPKAVTSYSIGTQSGCVNGNCPTSTTTTQRRGIFRR